MDYGNGQFAALCRDPHQICETVQLTQRDVLLQRLDTASFTKMLAGPLGIRWQPPEERTPFAWSIGLSKRRSSLNQPVFFSALFEQKVFRTAALELLVGVPGPFVLVAPTSQHRTVEIQEHFERRGVSFVSLDEQILLDDDGRLVSLDPIESLDHLLPTPVEDRQRLVDDFRAKHDCTMQAIADAAEVHIRDLYKWVASGIKDSSKKSKRVETTLRRGFSKRPGR